MARLTVIGIGAVLHPRLRHPERRHTLAPVHDRLPSKEMLATVIRICSSKTRASVLLLASSGMRVGELVRLRVADLKLSETPPAVKIQDTLRPHRWRISYMTAEARQAVESYLEERRNRGDLLCDHTPVFAYESGSSMTPQAMVSLIRRAFDAAGIRGPRMMLDSQVFRRWFKTQVIRAGAPRVVVDFLCGRPGGVKPTDEELKRWYVRAVPGLTIVSAT